MKGLILKDFYVSVKYLRSYFVIIAVFIGLSVVSSDFLFCAFYPCMVCAMFPQSLLAHDERCKWDVYAGTLPVTKAQIVSSKYIFSLLLLAVVLLLSGGVQAVRMCVTGVFDWGNYLTILALILILGCVSCSIQLPFVFRFGSEKGTIAYYAMILVASGGSILFGSFFDEGYQPEIPAGGALPLVCLAAVGMLTLSWYLSVRFYQKREIH